jgi:hypothetical protein
VLRESSILVSAKFDVDQIPEKLEQVLVENLS